MAPNPSKFQQLLYDGITEIQRYESHRGKKARRKIHEELGKGIGRKATTIEYYLQGNIPTSLHEIEQLARMIVRRGQVDGKWLKDFLTAADHRKAADFIVELTSIAARPIEEQTKFQYKRLHHFYKRTFFSDRSSVVHNIIEMQAISPYGLPNVQHRTILPSYKSKSLANLEFVSISRSGEGTISHHVFNNTSDLLLWNAIFSPPLRKSETAKYEYKVYKNDLFPWTLEECQQYYAEGGIPTPLASTSVTVIVPTDILYIEIELPPEYDIVLPSSGGLKVTVLSNEDLAEKTRLLKERCFQVKYNDKNKQWRLMLSVTNPEVGYAYGLEWIPPSESLLKNAH